LKKTKYPNYDVLGEQTAWDDTTRSIVLSRTEAAFSYSYLTLVEVEMLRALCSMLAGDTRANVIQFVLQHIDRTVNGPTPESERGTAVPQASELVRTGLKLIDQWCLTTFSRPLIDLTEMEQHTIVSDLSEGKLPLADPAFPQKALFRRLLSWTVESYYSHPTVWSEIGYGGPAYPRGYVRTQIGQLDPWEAKPEP